MSGSPDREPLPDGLMETGEKKVILYCSLGAKTGTIFREIIGTGDCGYTVRLVQDLGELDGESAPGTRKDLALVICPVDKIEIQRLESILSPVSSGRLILILPDEDPETLAAARRMKPRHILSPNDDLLTVRSFINGIRNEPGDRA